MKKEFLRIEITGGFGKSYLANFIKNEFPKYSKDKVNITGKLMQEPLHHSNGNIVFIERHIKGVKQ